MHGKDLFREGLEEQHWRQFLVAGFIQFLSCPAPCAAFPLGSVSIFPLRMLGKREREREFLLTRKPPSQGYTQTQGFFTAGRREVDKKLDFEAVNWCVDVKNENSDMWEKK